MSPSFTLQTCHCGGGVSPGEPQCNRKQMQSLIMQANVHRLACLMASHRQRAQRTYRAI